MAQPLHPYKEVLLIWIKDGASDVEIKVWEQIKAIETLKGAVFLEVHDRQEAEREYERLEAEGWMLQSVGHGIFQRMSSWFKL